jgi:hypothetical protein
MIDPSSKAGRELKAAEEFFELARTANSPFMRGYYRRVAERYLLSQGELKSVKKQADGAVPDRQWPIASSVGDRAL